MSSNQYFDALRRAAEDYNRKLRDYNRRVDQHNQTVVQQINRYNQAVNDHNREAARRIDRYNQEVYQQAQRRQTAIDQYNREVDRFNSQLLAERQRIASALSVVRHHSIASEFTTLRSSAVTLNQYFETLNGEDHSYTSEHDRRLVSEYPARENANSLEIVAGLQGARPDTHQPIQLDTTITNELQMISDDLNARWHGAIFSLHPGNPDAARHFCTSAREILTGILESKVPDAIVLTAHPNCDKTRDGKPTRREKVKFCLRKKGILSHRMEGFVNQDIDNIVELFGVFNHATHGAAGRFGLIQLMSIKKRVEDGILFLTKIVG